MRIIFLFRPIILITVFFGLMGSKNELKNGNNLSTSIIIPCHFAHATHLFDLLSVYEQQTVLPDEIVISLSEYGRITDGAITSLEQELWSFPATLVLSRQKLHPGQNRNIAAMHASGRILICQDADDLPHPQRVEIIKYFFKEYALDFLMHQYYLQSTEEASIIRYYDNLASIHCFRPQTFQQAWDAVITNGNIAFIMTPINRTRAIGKNELVW